MQEYFCQPQNLCQPTIIKQQTNSLVFRHPITIATKITNRLLHIYVYLNADQQLKLEKRPDQMLNTGSMEAKNIYYSYLEQEVLRKQEKLNDWFSTLQQFQEYIQDPSNVLVDLDNKVLRVMITPFEGKIKRVQIWRLKLCSQQEIQQTQARNYLSSMDNKTQISNLDIKMLLKIMAKKLLNFCQGHHKDPQKIVYQQRSNYSKQPQISAMREIIKTLQIELKKFRFQHSHLMSNMMKKMEQDKKAAQSKFTQLLELIQSKKHKIQKNKEEGRHQDNRKDEVLSPTRQPSDQLLKIQQCEKLEQDNSIEVITDTSQKIKQEPRQLRNRHIYKIKSILPIKHQISSIPSFIDVYSAYLKCFTFEGAKITLSSRPNQSEARQIMLMTNLAINLHRVNTYKIRIPKFLTGSVSFGVIDCKYRNKKFCKSKDNFIKISSKGLVFDGFASYRQNQFRFRTGDVVAMNIDPENSLVQWKIISDEGEEITTSITSSRIKESKNVWVPFLEMKRIGDAVEWIV